MVWVFNVKRTTRWYRFKVWLKDLGHLLFALPSYINPKPLEPSELTEEELAMLDENFEPRRDDKC